MEPLPASVVGVFPFIAAGDLSVGPLIAVILTGWLVSLGLVVSKRRVGLMLAAALGLAVSIYLGLQHAADAGTSVCSVSEVFNCDTVNRSKYSELMGVPIAFLGAGFYAAVLAVAGGLLRKPEGYSRAGHAIFAGSLVGVAYSVFLAWASMQVGAWCLFCISLYGLNGILLFGGAQEARASGTGALMAGIAPALMGKQDRSIGVMVPVGLVTVFVTNAMFGGGHGEPSSTVTAADAASGEVRSED